MPVQARATCCRHDLSLEVRDMLQHRGAKRSNAYTALENEGAEVPQPILLPYKSTSVKCKFSTCRNKLFT